MHAPFGPLVDGGASAGSDEDDVARAAVELLGVARRERSARPEDEEQADAEKT